MGQGEILKQVLACWLVVDENDQPLTPRLVGPPGIGKTQLAMAAADQRKQDLYIYQCTADTRPEDLLITPVLAESGKIAYHASPLVTAIINGCVCILDEGNRMNEKSWASLAPLLDHRRYIESIVAGISIKAHPDFRCAVTMNQDESTFEIPDYILSRLQPTLNIQFPSREDEKAILEYHLPFCAAEMLNRTVDFLQNAHELKLDFSTRDGINLCCDSPPNDYNKILNTRCLKTPHGRKHSSNVSAKRPPTSIKWLSDETNHSVDKRYQWALEISSFNPTTLCIPMAPVLATDQMTPMNSTKRIFSDPRSLRNRPARHRAPRRSR